jgi:hypothetical protein
LEACNCTGEGRQNKLKRQRGLRRREETGMKADMVLSKG